MKQVPVVILCRGTWYLLRYLNAVLADGREEQDDSLLLAEQVRRHLPKRRRFWGQVRRVVLPHVAQAALE